MKEFNLSKWRQFIIEEAVVADGNFGNDIEDRYAYIRPLMADLPDTARTETLIDGMEDGLREDDKELFDFYFVEAMKALGLEHQLMDDGGVEGPGIEDLTPDSALGPNPSFVEEGEDSLINPEAEEIDAEDLDASADYFDSLTEEKEKLDEVAAELVGQYGAEAVNGLYMLAGILGLPIAAVLSSVADGTIDIDLKGTLKDLYKSAGDSVKSKAKSLAKTLGLSSSSVSLNENKMTNLEKYIKQQIKEAKNPLAQKMKEIENQGRVAALETKLAAIAEMIEETNGRLTRIDEDNEFADMMDRNAVKEVRKQLKELEKAKDKLEKERAKMEGKVEKKKEPVVDEDAPIGEDIFDTAIDEIDLEEETFELNESMLRMQKLAGLITESDIQKKTKP